MYLIFGHVGIGTTAPENLFTILEPSTTALATNVSTGLNPASAGIIVKNLATASGGNDAWTGILFEGPESGTTTSYQGVVAGTNGLDFLDFYVSGRRGTLSTATPAMRINNSGNVGIGTTAPAGPLDVTGGYSYFGGLRISGSDSGNTLWNTGGPIAINTNGYSVSLGNGNGQQRLTVNGSTGNVGIGSTAPTQALDVAGAIATAAGQGFKVRYGSTSVALSSFTNGYAGTTTINYGYTFTSNPIVMLTNASLAAGYCDWIDLTAYTTGTSSFGAHYHYSFSGANGGSCTLVINWLAIGL